MNRSMLGVFFGLTLVGITAWAGTHSWRSGNCQGTGCGMVALPESSSCCSMKVCPPCPEDECGASVVSTQSKAGCCGPNEPCCLLGLPCCDDPTCAIGAKSSCCQNCEACILPDEACSQTGSDCCGPNEPCCLLGLPCCEAMSCCKEQPVAAKVKKAGSCCSSSAKK